MYKLTDLMTMFKIPERTIRRHLKEGLLTGTKIGGTWRFEENDIHKYLDNSKIIKANEKVALMEVLDYMNGFSKNEDDILILQQIDQLDEAKVKKLTSCVSGLENPFYLNMRKSNNKHIITFRGNRSDSQLLLNKLGDINE